ncbi:DUF2973 domain-containing protein [Anabaena cylindrica FACHB-243]|uniref:DUF2973 domain-containing protein n=1 Tax=Anabaena cylindrica (strain ATCC 27899 / PCC 7122) TaxID=272123 RepID=K9ZM22_ANACC|nr:MULTISPECIES: DUF2973 domain-containing protein [Anabaena]AFZ59375.1 hypothetical protein Anacy_4005 [Anabaena cylindrica PCC 7122]MBD2416766.1 DUF2973 domain-containing protein [Anabaena cylindrica FACHB-243]MBY5280243.1 DUF2973 domain-containing protein [Anabaena sp. CCAP 1446/1C]MBY5308515.1 DUF2973 domain-containing protein [Anabaena sp. CCAP 1446/1C]MCM2405293.1 DUF2973 domain-containing protein [Anabaena sp. CCAP 1446/1C]
MLHLLYILAFTVLAFIAVGNLIRNLVMFSFDRERPYPANSSSMGNQGRYGYYGAKKQFVPHPELLDNAGNLIKEPLLVMRSINVEDAREQLDALYESSPGQKIERSEEA